MDIKLLLSILSRPWCIEPSAAQVYGDYAMNIFSGGGVPVLDKREFYGNGSNDFRSLFRVDDKGTVQPEGSVQVIRINYPIAKYDYCGSPGTQTIQQHITAANNDSTVKSILLWIDSPGGTVDGTESLANAIRTSAKPVVSYTDGLMASASYWIGSSAKEVVSDGANKGWNATIGSIGTYAQFIDHSGKMEKEGIKVHVIPAAKSKDKLAKYNAIKSGDYSVLSEELDGLNDTFLTAVQTNRAGKINLELEDVLTGKTYNAKDALKYGLIDKIGDFTYAVKRSLQLAREAHNNNISTKKTMAKFPRTLAAAKAEQDFEVLNEGIWLTEEQLGNLEASLVESATQLETSQAAATEANQTNTSLQAKVDELTTAATKSAETIASLEQEVKRLGKMDAKGFSTAGSAKEDDFESSDERINDPKLSMNEAADRIMYRR